MATKADRKKWDSLHVAQAKAQAAESEFDLALARKYHASYQDSWLTRPQRDKKERLREKRREIESKIIDLLVKISPRGDRWLSGAPAHWLATELTWEDAIRPANEPLSVVVPGSYGSPDGTVREERTVASKDAQEFKEFLDKAVLLVDGDGDVIDLDDPEPVRVAIIVDVNGYGPHVGAIYAMQRGHVDEALQSADEILDEWTVDHYPDQADNEHRTETFDGRSWTMPVEEFADAVEGTPAEKFIEIVGYEDDEELGDEEE